MNIIEIARTNKGISQSALARMCKISPSYISKLESNKKIPRGDTISIIANALEICPFEIYNFFYLDNKCTLFNAKNAKSTKNTIPSHCSACRKCFLQSKRPG